MTLVLQNEQQVMQAIDAGTVKVGVVIPPNFEIAGTAAAKAVS